MVCHRPIGSSGKFTRAAQCVLRQFQQLRSCYGRKVSFQLANDATIGRAVVRSQIFSKVLGRIAFPRAMTDHDNSAARSQGLADSLIKAGILRSTLALLARLIFMRKMMEEVMRVIRLNLAP